MLEDIAVLSKNLLTFDAVEIEGLAVDLTIVGGEIVYERPVVESGG